MSQQPLTAALAASTTTGFHPGLAFTEPPVATPDPTHSPTGTATTAPTR
ncbi:hypothetical protein [Streptacidiphilus carbonis]|nr:hypothetical protein [Streptacidiphilus carbonis]